MSRPLAVTPKAAQGDLTRRRPGFRGDATSLLTVYLVLQFGLPAPLVLGGPLGAAGAPAALWGLLMLTWRIGVWMRSGTPLPMPMRTAFLLFLLSTLASYTAAATRAIGSNELRAADRMLLMTLSWLGVVLTIADTLDERDRFIVFLRRLVVAVELMALCGIIQFFTGQNLAARIQFPGLHSNLPTGTAERYGLNRPSSTSTHPIEFGFVLALVLPLALHFALYQTGRRRRRPWVGVAMIGFALPLSLSKSAIIATIVASLVLLPTWPAHRVRKVVAGLPFLLIGLRIAVKGLVGTLLALFTGASNDTSTSSRTAAYGPAGHLISQHPLFGRGPGTYLPQTYRFLDNQYLGLLIQNGLVGTFAFLGLVATGVLLARRARHLVGDEAGRDLAQCIVASICAGTVAFAFFDAFSFPQASATLMILLGSAGALWRFAVDEHQAGTSVPAGEEPAIEVGHRGAA